MTFLVHGASGAQGSPVLSGLLAAGLPARALVRHPERLQGLDSAAVDLASADSLTAAYDGADGVFVHLPLGDPGTQRVHALAVAEAVRRARPARVVFSTSGYPFDPSGAGGDAPNLLARELEGSGVSYAVVEPRLFLENLLLPPLQAEARRGTLPYPLPAGYATSWSSHLDVADVVVRLLTRHDVGGVVSVGALPGLVGADLAGGFARYLGDEVRYRPISPEEMGRMIRPLFGEAATAPVVAAYAARQGEPGDVIPAERSAQQRLGLRPRRVEDWLHAVLGEPSRQDPAA